MELLKNRLDPHFVRVCRYKLFNRGYWIHFPFYKVISGWPGYVFVNPQKWKCSILIVVWKTTFSQSGKFSGSNQLYFSTFNANIGVDELQYLDANYLWITWANNTLLIIGDILILISNRAKLPLLTNCRYGLEY